jgi:hypothetical protein
MNIFKRTFQDLQFDSKMRSFELLVQKLCLIEFLKFSSLMRYNCVFLSQTRIDGFDHFFNSFDSIYQNSNTIFY